MAALTLFVERLSPGRIARLHAPDQLVLRFEQRQKARLRTRLESGREVGIQLARGTILRGGDLLRADSGEIVRVVAAAEPVSTVTGQDPLALARGAYHLGNRHVSLEVGQGYLRYLADHVLDHMVESLGLRVRHENAAFEPEGGAYHHGHDRATTAAHTHGDSHGHGHSHGHGDEERHGHSHEHEHDR
jgi:urease accessory protein